MSAQDDGTDVRTEIGDYIRENYLYMSPELRLQSGDSLLGLGLIDSLAFVELVEHVQERHGVEVEDREITEDNFGSIDAIAEFVKGKRGR